MQYILVEEITLLLIIAIVSLFQTPLIKEFECVDLRKHIEQKRYKKLKPYLDKNTVARPSPYSGFGDDLLDSNS